MEWLKTFGPTQNILGPVKGQGNSLFAQILCQIVVRQNK